MNDCANEYLKSGQEICWKHEEFKADQRHRISIKRRIKFVEYILTEAGEVR